MPTKKLLKPQCSAARRLKVNAISPGHPDYRVGAARTFESRKIQNCKSHLDEGSKAIKFGVLAAA
jgi:hypothetical protein